MNIVHDGGKYGLILSAPGEDTNSNDVSVWLNGTEYDTDTVPARDVRMDGMIEYDTTPKLTYKNPDYKVKVPSCVWSKSCPE